MPYMLKCTKYKWFGTNLQIPQKKRTLDMKVLLTLRRTVMSDSYPPKKSFAEEFMNRVTYHPPTPDKIEKHKDIREAIYAIGKLINSTVPPGREQSIAITKLEEVMFWSNAGIARHQNGGDESLDAR